MGRRGLVTGLGSFWGGRVAQALEQRSDVDVIIGLDTREPTVELERTEYVRSDDSYSILSRIVRATQVDTIVHTFLVVDSSQASSRQMHEINVIGTMNLFAAASQPESRVCNVVVKSSTLVYGSTFADPVWFTEDSRRSALPRHPIERSLLEVEGYVRDYADDNPNVSVSLLRFSNVLGEEIATPITRALDLPLVPAVFGFDPRLQFVHEIDVIRAIMFVLEHDLDGTFNVAGDGLLPWSEVVAMRGKRLGPLPPIGRGRARLRRCGTAAGHRRRPPGLPLRAGRRAVLPPLPRRHPRLTGHGRRPAVEGANCRSSTSARARSAGCRGRRSWRWPRGSSNRSCPGGSHHRRCS